jgi:heme exporter protein B
VSELLRATLLLLRKELTIELRTGEITVTTGLFSALVAVLTSLAFYIDPESSRRVAPGVLWIAIAFSGVLAMGRSWAREREHEVYRALLLAPLPRAAIYLSKVLSSVVFLVVVELVLVLLVGVLYSVDFTSVLLPLCGLLVLGSLGFCAAGNLFAALSLKSRAREMMLSVIVFPVITPALLSAVVGTRELRSGAPTTHHASWLMLLGAFDLATLAAGFVLFEPLLSD